MCGLLSVKTRKTQHSRDPRRTTHDALPMTHLPTRFSHPPDKYNLFHVVSYELKKNLEPAIIWKLVTCQQITKKLIVDTWAHDMVRWYWSVDTLSWQLICNMSAVSVCWAPKLHLARKCEIKHRYACGQCGRTGSVRSCDTKFSGMGRFTYPWCSAGARFACTRARL